MNITATYLRKKHRGRMINVDTLLIGCGILHSATDTTHILNDDTAKCGVLRNMKGGELLEIESSCKNNEITGIQSIKSSEEDENSDDHRSVEFRRDAENVVEASTGDEPNEFVHVIKSVLDNYKKPVIVKIHDSVSYFVEKEITALNKLSEFENSVKKICDFSCFGCGIRSIAEDTTHVLKDDIGDLQNMDDKARWKHMINHPIKFCNNKKNRLHFIVLEYIENGDIDLFFSKNPSKEMICSFFLQIELSIIKLALDYRISHGDLNSGNILISGTEKSRIHYKIMGKEYRIASHGIIPKFIDYGRSTNYVGKIYPSYILDDIYTCLSVLVIYMKNEELKTKFQQFIVDESKTNTSDLHRILLETKKILLD